MKEDWPAIAQMKELVKPHVWMVEAFRNSVQIHISTSVFLKLGQNMTLHVCLLAVCIVTKLWLPRIRVVRFDNLKVTYWNQTITCDNRKTRGHLMASILFVVRPFLEFARLV